MTRARSHAQSAGRRRGLRRHPFLQEIVMNTRLHAAIALTAIGLSTFAFTQGARACGLGDALPSSGPAAAASFAALVATAAGAGPAAAVQGRYVNPLQMLEPITGLYRFTFTVQGHVADQGFVTWHADGTELMNSGKPAITGNFCMGAWKQTGAHSYVLNHWALNWDNSGQVFLGPVNINERITLARDNNSYSGNFTLTQYTPDGKQPAGPSVMGTVTAMRVMAEGN
jgi:hypothetical protein